MAHVIERTQRPALIMAPNKTLAAQVYGEMKEFFPTNAVEYFVSYYDYYQPEAYVPRTDTFIEKEAVINEEIDRMRHSATQALLQRSDVIIVASVSCIYGLGSAECYQDMALTLKEGQDISLLRVMKTCQELQYHRNDMTGDRGTYRLRGQRLDIFPSHYRDWGWRMTFQGPGIQKIQEIHGVTGQLGKVLPRVTVYPNNHYVTPGPTLTQAITHIRRDLEDQCDVFHTEGKVLEEQRLRQRVTMDMETLEATGLCRGIENYSRYLTGRTPGDPPPTLLDYLPTKALLIMDESHLSVPQIRGMSRGDRARKLTLTSHGFRLPSCQDNRPLTFEEWDAMRPCTLHVSATPGPWELEQTHHTCIEQIIRPTGLLDPVVDVRPSTYQMDDLLPEVRATIAQGYRVLVTTLTKKMAEALGEFFQESGIKCRYLHADVKTLDRMTLIHELRQGTFDVLVGINLLREGLDIPECGLVAILDGDKEGYLRSRSALIQTMGRAARNVSGRVIIYADTRTKSLQHALEESQRRREKQQAYNTLHGITPVSTRSLGKHALNASAVPKKRAKIDPEDIRTWHIKMQESAEALNFERAAYYRDLLKNNNIPY